MNSIFKHGCLLFEGYLFVDESSDLYPRFNHTLKESFSKDDSLKRGFISEVSKLFGEVLSKCSIIVISEDIPIAKFGLFRFSSALGMFGPNDIFETRVVVKDLRVKLSRRIRRLTSALHHYLFEKNLCDRIYALVRCKPGNFSDMREKFDTSTDNPTKHFFFEGDKDREFEKYMFFVKDMDIDILGKNYGVIVIDKDRYLKMDLDYYWNMFKEIKT